MDVASEMQKKHGCCMENKSMAGTCHKPPAEKQKTKKDCCPKAETTCICLCCFQFAAPGQVAIKFYFKAIQLLHSYNSQAEQLWKDPFLSVPWQPPDLTVSV